jgi:hypothetical protein
VIFDVSTVLRLVEVDPLPGWTYEVKSGGNTDGRIEVEFTSVTGDRAHIRVEPGRPSSADVGSPLPVEAGG